MDFRSIEEALLLTLIAENYGESKQLIKSKDIDFDRLVRLAHRHKLLPLICNRLLLIAEVLPQEVLENAKRTLIASAALHTHIRHKLHTFTEQCSKHDIDFLLIKGYAIEKSPLRQMSDLDVLINKKDIENTFEVLQSYGYLYVGSGVLSKREMENPQSQYRWNNQYQFQAPDSNLVIEVHTNLFEKDRIRLENLDGLLENVDIFWQNRIWDSDLQCYLPVKEATLALLCVHSATKRSPAANTFIIRQAHDIAKLLENGINEEYYLSICTTFRIQYYAFFSLSLTAKILKSESAEKLSRDLKSTLTKGEKYLGKVHLRCYKGPGNASVLRRKQYALFMPLIIGGGFTKSIRWYKEAIFAPLWIQEKRFGIDRTSPLIYLTYLFGPIYRISNAIKNRKMEKKARL